MVAGAFVVTAIVVAGGEGTIGGVGAFVVTEGAIVVAGAAVVSEAVAIVEQQLFRASTQPIEQQQR